MNEKSGRFVLTTEMLENHEFKTIMASVLNSRLWVIWKNGGSYFRVENLRNGETILETQSIGEAVRKFNDTMEV